MDEKKIVIWEQDIVWVEELVTGLKRLGLHCEEIDSKEELFEIFQNGGQAELCILSERALESDVTVRELVSEIDEKYSISVVYLMESNNVAREVAAFRMGVSEVLIKENGTEIAVERIRVILKWRCKKTADAGIPEESFGHIFSDVYFTVTEKQVLYELYKNAGTVITRKELVGRFWLGKERKDDRVVDTVIKQIRKKIQHTSYQIISIYGQGYLLKRH